MPGRRSRLNLLNIFLWLLGGGILLLAGIGAFLTMSQGRLSAEQWQSLIIAGIALSTVGLMVLARR